VLTGVDPVPVGVPAENTSGLDAAPSWASAETATTAPEFSATVPVKSLADDVRVVTPPAAVSPPTPVSRPNDTPPDPDPPTVSTWPPRLTSPDTVRADE